MMASARKRGVQLSFRVARHAVKILERARSRPNFGNAGAVDNLLSKAITKMQSRGDRGEIDELNLQDFELSGDGTDESVLDSFAEATKNAHKMAGFIDRFRGND
jgi:hypothetical protein